MILPRDVADEVTRRKCVLQSNIRLLMSAATLLEHTLGRFVRQRIGGELAVAPVRQLC